MFLLQPKRISVTKALLFILCSTTSNTEAFQHHLISPTPANTKLLWGTNANNKFHKHLHLPLLLSMSASSSSTSSSSSSFNQQKIVKPSWDELKVESGQQLVGAALNNEVEKRKEGKGSAHVQSNLRLFSSDEKPKLTLYRDHAGCTYNIIGYKYYR